MGKLERDHRMAMRDKKVYPHEPEQHAFAENDGDTDTMRLALRHKESESEDKMPNALYSNKPFEKKGRFT